MKVLLVCSGNTCRSPMAGALLQHLWTGDQPLTVLTAGTSTTAGQPASGHAITAMAERGLDLGAHRSQPVTERLVREADLILTMTSRHRDALRFQWPALAIKVQSLSEYAGQLADVPDPFGGPLVEYQRTAESLARLLAAAVARMQRKESQP
jgi:protein-tyrosine-phosphatase